MKNSGFHILFLAPAGRTEAILTSGLLKRLLDEVGAARFTVVAGPDEAPLFRETPQLDEIILVRGERLIDTVGLWRRLHGRTWDFLLDAAGSPVARFLNARRRSSPASLDEPRVHRLIRAAALLQLEADPPPPFLFISDETRERAAGLIGPGGPVLAMAPAVSWAGSAWPLERFARLAVQLLGDDGALAGGRLLAAGAPEDWREAELLRRSIPRDRWIDLSTEPDPLVISACLAQARLFIGGAGWLTHLAAASGTPTLGLYGPTDDAIEGVWGERARVVRGPRKFEAIRAIDPRLNQTVCHMLDLQTETVLQAALDLLHETSPLKTAPPERKRRRG